MMTAATQRIVSWPRLMRAEVLGAYCGISKNTVKKDVRDGRLTINPHKPEADV